MPLTTLTFETLRERNERSLDRAGYISDGDITDLTKRKRERIGTLLAQRAAVEDLASAQDQREAYGIERFHDTFVLLRSVEQHPQSNDEGEKLRWRIWQALPSGPFKRFQELFSREFHFIIPPYTIGDRGNIHFEGNVHSLSLEPCLVSADRITDDFAQSIGLCTFTEDDTPLTRLEKKRAAIPRLKLLFTSAEQVHPRSHRILAVTRPSPEIASHALGTLLYIREQGTPPRSLRKRDPHPPRSLIVQHFTSVYDAHRKTHHERMLYEQEIDRLSEFQTELQTFNRTLNSDWRRDTPGERKRELEKQAGHLLTACTEELQFCENQYKVRALDLLGDCGRLLEEKNVSAAMSKMVAAVGSLERRFREMYPKGGCNEEDRMVLQRTLHSHEVILKRYRRSIEDVANTAAAHMHLDICSLDAVTLEPFRTYAARLREKHGEYEAARDHDPDAAQRALIQSHVIGKFQAVRTCFEHIKMWLVDGGSVPVGRIRDFVSTLHDIFASRQIFPESIVEEYIAPFEEMQRALQAIEQRLMHYGEQDPDVSRRSRIYLDLRRYLDTFDIETIVRDLP